MKVTRKDIIELSQQEPVVGAVLRYWQSGELTWEEAMMVCVWHLWTQNKTLMENYKKDMMRVTVPVIPLPISNCITCGAKPGEHCDAGLHG